MHVIHANIKTEVVTTKKSLVTVGNGSHCRVLRNKTEASGAEQNFQEGLFGTDTWREGPRKISSLGTMSCPKMILHPQLPTPLKETGIG